MTREQYIKFLSEVYRQNNGAPLGKDSVKKYATQSLPKIDSYLKILMPESNYNSVFEIATYYELELFKELLYSCPQFVEEDEKGHRMYSAGFNRFMEFAKGALIAKFCKDTSPLDVREPIHKWSSVKEREFIERDSVVIHQAKEASLFSCQINPGHKTFISESTKQNYVEGHHIIPLCCQEEFNNSLDVFANIIVLCPTCHRRLHYAVKQERIDELYKLYDDRAERFNNTGLLIDRPSFVEMAMYGIRKKTEMSLTV